MNRVSDRDGPTIRPAGPSMRPAGPSMRPAGSSAGDGPVIEMGGPLEETPRPVPWRKIGVVVGVLLAAGAGFAAGDRYSARPASAGATVPTVTLRIPATQRDGGLGQPYDASAIVSTGAQCAFPTGRRLQLGIEIENPTTIPLRFHAEPPYLPLGGLKVITTLWGTCGQLNSSVAYDDIVLPPGARTWLTAVVDMLDPCPAPYPVEFRLDYEGRDGRPAYTILRGFNDLGGIVVGDCTDN